MSKENNNNKLSPNAPKKEHLYHCDSTDEE